MNRIEYLEKCRSMAYYNLGCYSRNLSMTAPKPNCKDDWDMAKEECQIVEELIADVKGYTVEGTIGAAIIDGKVVDNWQEVLGVGEALVKCKGAIEFD